LRTRVLGGVRCEESRLSRYQRRVLDWGHPASSAPGFRATVARRLIIGLLVILLAGFFAPAGRAGDILGDGSQDSLASDTTTAEGDGTDETTDAPSSAEEDDPQAESATPLPETSAENEGTASPAEPSPENEEITPPAEPSPENEEITPPAEPSPENEEITPPADTGESEETVPPVETSAESPSAEIPIETRPEGSLQATPPQDPLLSEGEGCLPSGLLSVDGRDLAGAPAHAAPNTRSEQRAAKERRAEASAPKCPPGNQPSSGAANAPVASASGTNIALSVEFRGPVPAPCASILRSSFGSAHSLVVASRLERPG
jgi:hypothetical protein